MARLTKEQKRQEILRCARDPVYFIKNYCRIAHPIHGNIPFTTFDFQDELIRDFRDHRFNVILKARQLGISTIVAAYIVHLMLFSRDKNVLVMATKQATASNLVRKVKKMFKQLPEHIKIADIEVDNRNSFELNNGSQIKPSSKAEDAGRSESLSLLVVDEAAFVDGLDEVWKSIAPTISTGGRCIALSTPNGVGNWFHKTYVEAESKENNFKPTRLMWDLHPDRDQAWFEKETKNMSPRDIAQEYQCSFNMSGETVLDPRDIHVMREQSCDPTHRTGFDRNYWIWDIYNPQNTYLIVVDTARGDGNDYSAFVCMNVETMECVAEYKGKLEPEMFADIVYNAGQEYGNAMIVVEYNNLGSSISEKLLNKHYPNLYYETKGTHEYVEPIYAQTANNVIPGFTTSKGNRSVIIAKMEEFVRNRAVNTRSNRLINEFDTFVWHNGRPEAQRGSNDDLIMCFAISCWVRDTVLKVSDRDIEYKKAMMNSIIVTGTKFQTSISGMQGYKRQSDPFRKSIETEAKKQQQEYLWLYKG